MLPNVTDTSPKIRNPSPAISSIEDYAPPFKYQQSDVLTAMLMKKKVHLMSHSKSPTKQMTAVLEKTPH